MEAGSLYGPKDIRLGEMPEPQIGADEVLRESHAAGICGTELLITNVQPLAAIDEAFDQVDRDSPETIKIVLEIK